jgi:hypothetical protein
MVRDTATGDPDTTAVPLEVMTAPSGSVAGGHVSSVPGTGGHVEYSVIVRSYSAAGVVGRTPSCMSGSHVSSPTPSRSSAKYVLIPASAASIAWTRLRSKELWLTLCSDSAITVMLKKRTTTDTIIAVTMASPRSSRSLMNISAAP